MPWFDTVRRNIRVADEICDGTAGARDTLIGPRLALDTVPSNLLDLYSAIPEADLVSESSRLLARADTLSLQEYDEFPRSYKM